ncbi:alpha-amylase family glycosyl hydrolase [Arthrobacter monumenti]
MVSLISAIRPRRRRGLRRGGAAVVAAAVIASSGAALPAQATPEQDGSDEPSALHSLRAPVSDENFYFVMADRFENGDPANDDAGLGNDPMVSGFDPTDKGFYNGGDLAGLLERIDYIEGLGTTSIWLTPSFKNKPVQPEDGSAGYHGYWITDFTQIDPHLGTNEELKKLIDEAHSRGMKVYFDIITNHTADVIGYEEGARAPYIPKDAEPYETAAGVPFDDRDYAGTEAFPQLDPETSFPYTPVLEPEERTLKVPAWLNDPSLYHNRGDTTFAGENSYYGDFFGLDDLFTEDPRVVNGMIDIYQTWIADFGIDGFRIDTMKHVNDKFWQKFGPEVLSFAKAQGKEEFFMFGEVFDTDKAYTSRFTTKNNMQAVLDFPFQDAARNFASRGQDADALMNFFAADDWYTDADSNAYQLPTFLGNHDMGRIGSFIMADNPQGAESEWLERSELAHELMYFSRGNPVVYYGDEQGFTGPGGDQNARQSMFASQVPDYQDDELLGTTSTHASDNFNTSHPLYQHISGLAAITEEHPTLRDGAHQNRYASNGRGIYAFSRIDAQDQREYVVAVNNSESEASAQVDTFIPKRNFTKIYGEGAGHVKTSEEGNLSLSVPALSTVVYQSSGRIPHSNEAPDIELAEPAAAAADNGRMHVAADVDGSSFYEVTFEAKVADGEWKPIGTDDNSPYQVFHDISGLEPGMPIDYRAVVLDNAGHTSISQVEAADVPSPILTMELPEENSDVQDEVEVRAVAEPEKATYTVRFERSVDGGEWTSIGSDDSSPAYTVSDDLATLELAEGTQVRYRALLGNVVSDIRTVTVGNDVQQPETVAVAGSLNTEIGCPEDWQPNCYQAQMTFVESEHTWKLTIQDLPSGQYEFKAALDRSWTENYGAGGIRHGANIPLDHPGGAVTLHYDHQTHVISAR